MNTKMFYSSLELTTLREIRRESKNKDNLNIQKLKDNLAERGYKVEFSIKQGKIQSVSFEKDNFKIDSINANQRGFTNTILKQLEKNRESFRDVQNRNDKAVSERKEIAENQIKEVRSSRDERTSLYNQDIFKSKDLGR